MNYLVPYALAFVIGAVLMDLAFGEPPNPVHPVAWMGKVIGFLDRITRRTGHVIRDRAAGALVALIPLIVFVFIFTLALGLLMEVFGALVWAVACALLLKTLFAIKSLGTHVRPVSESLRAGDLAEARKRVSMVVSRDTGQLDAGHVASCAVETVAENTVDSIVSPFLFLGLAGIPGAIFYRVSNTLDAMVGYRTPRYEHVGWFSAKLDDATNFIGARLSVPFILLALWIMRLDWNRAWRTALRDHGKTSSPNKGWPMAAFAGGLGIRMEKIGWYALGDGPLPENPRHIRDAVRLAEASSLLFLVLVALPLFIVLGLQVQLLLEQALAGLFGGIA